MKQTFKHQGDIPLFPHTGEIVGNKIDHNGSVVLALGEKTGHKHVITVPDILDMDAYKIPEGGWILTLRKEGQLTHNQHGALTIAPGTYRVGQEREFDHFATVERRVID